MKQVIHIFGASGSGTSTLGRKICAELGYTFLDADDYFWMPTDPKYTTKRPAAERVALMRADILHAENAVVSGSIADWGNELIPLFTLAVRLETDTAVRLERLRQREKAAFGSRIEPGGDMYRIHTDFLNWAAAYDNGGVEMRSKAKHDEWQKQLHCKLLVLNGAGNLSDNFLQVQSELNTHME